MKKSTRTILIAGIVGLFLILGVGVAYGANNSKPGDLLHPLDKAMEDAQRAITIRPASEAQLEMDILDERMDELEKIATELSKKTETELPQTDESGTIVPSCSENEIECWKKLTNNDQTTCKIAAKCFKNKDGCSSPWTGEEPTCQEEPPPEEPPVEPPPEEPPVEPPPEEPPVEPPPEEPPPEEPPPEEPPPEEPPPEEPPPEEPPPEEPPEEPSTPNEPLAKTTNPIARFLFLTYDATDEEFDASIEEAIADIEEQESRVEEELITVGEEYEEGNLDRIDECQIIKRITEEMDRQLTIISYLSDTMAYYDYDDEAVSLMEAETSYGTAQQDAIEVFLEE